MMKLSVSNSLPKGNLDPLGKMFYSKLITIQSKKSILLSLSSTSTSTTQSFQNISTRQLHSHSQQRIFKLNEKGITTFTKNENYSSMPLQEQTTTTAKNNKIRWWIILLTTFGSIGATSFGYYLNDFLKTREMENELLNKEIVKDKLVDGTPQREGNDNDTRDKSTLSIEELEPLQYNTNPEEINQLLDELKEILENDSNNYSMTSNDLKQHSDSDFNTHHPTENQRPLIILFPKSTSQVSQIMIKCHKFNVPVIPFSGGSSLEGHFLPTRYPTICIDISKYMDNVIKFDKTDLDVTVQGGVPWESLNDFLNDQGLLFGCDPGPGAEIAGCVANSCSGTNAYRYGTMKENILSCKMVLPDGTIIKTKQRPKKSSAGYNLNGLICGSEGTLGIITEVTVKCHVKPKFENVIVVSFPTIEEAAACTSNITREGIPVNAMELLDDNMMHLININDQCEKDDWIEKPTIFFKIGGSTSKIIDELIMEMEKVSKKHHAINFEFARDNETMTELWEARKVALWSVLDSAKKLSPNAKIWTTDVAVPISKFSDIIKESKIQMNESGLINAIAGHAGDGNFHAFIVYTNKEELNKCEKIVQDMVKRAIHAEGTCTGEHGIGIGKRQYLLQEIGEAPVNLMRKIKLAIDPKRLMNPDKIFTIDPNEPSSLEHEF